MEEERSEALTKESYAARAARTGHANVRNENLINMNNKLPGRPCTACFTPSSQTSASSVFDAFDKAKIGEKDISCLHHDRAGKFKLLSELRP